VLLNTQMCTGPFEGKVWSNLQGGGVDEGI